MKTKECLHKESLALHRNALLLITTMGQRPHKPPPPKTRHEMGTKSGNWSNCWGHVTAQNLPHQSINPFIYQDNSSHSSYNRTVSRQAAGKAQCLLNWPSRTQKGAWIARAGGERLLPTYGTRLHWKPLKRGMKVAINLETVPILRPCYPTNPPSRKWRH